MSNQEIIDNAPPNTSIVDSRFSFFDKSVSELNKYGFWNWKKTSPSYPIRSLADIKRIVELETCLINMRELLSGQKDKSCLGTGYPANENDCAPWPIIDEAINEITQALKEPKP